jgi:arabinan endo-1,5-alpha-L-arabinosidase
MPQAPDVFLADGTYYAFYSVSKLGLQNSSIGVATSASLAQGTWTDHGAIHVPQSADYNLIDPNLFRHGAGEPFYFAFGSAWNEIYQTQLTEASGFLDQAAGAAPVQLAYNATLYADGSHNSNTEGSYQFWYKDSAGTSWFYLFFSSGKCCGRAFNGGAGSFAAAGDEYKIMVCRSSSITGPYVDKNGNSCKTQSGGSLVLMSHDNIYAPGGQGVFYDDKVGRVAMYYHYVDMSLDEGYLYENFRFGFNYLDFSSGWPVVTA